jgi:hypothetical protein
MRNYEPKVQRLNSYEEVVGVLNNLNRNCAFLIAQIGNLNIALPAEMEDKLIPFIGMKIGILHTDITGKEFLVRSIQIRETTCKAIANPIAQCCLEVA